jgi:competence ComEA-like helix-hairpin-helix protein
MRHNRLYNLLAAAAILLSAVFALNEFVFARSYPVSVTYNIPPQPAPVIEPQFAQSAQEPEPEPESEPEEEPFSAEFPLDINLATQRELELIPGVGNVTAQRIIQYREHLGGYTSLEQLMEISGIGEGTYGDIEAYLVVWED